MSVQALTWAFNQQIGSSGAKFVLVALADHADVDGWCHPGQKRLAKYTDMSDRSVRTHLVWLEEKGFIKRVRRARTDGSRSSDGYWLVGYQRWSGRLDDQTPEDSATGEKQQDNRQIPLSNRKNPPLQPEESAYHEPSVEPSDRTVSESTAAEPPSVPRNDPGVIYVKYKMLRFPKARKLPNDGFVWGVARRIWNSIADSDYTLDDVLACMEWLHAQPYWRGKGWTLTDVEKQLDRFLGEREEPPERKQRLDLTEQNDAAFAEFRRMIGVEGDEWMGDDESVIEAEGGIVRD